MRNPFIAHERKRSDKFVSALQKRDKEEVNRILKVAYSRDSPLNPRKRLVNYNTFLHFAAFHNDLNAVQILINEGCDVNAENRQGYTPLLLSFHMFRIDPVNYSEKECETIVSYLLDNGADINHKCRKDYTTAVWFACQNNLLEILKLLIRRGADISEPDIIGQTPLMMAAGQGYEGIIRELIRNRVDLNAVSKEGYTAIHFARYHAKENIVTILLESGAANINNSEIIVNPVFRQEPLSFADRISEW
jgi:ankyrin repeat protein